MKIDNSHAYRAVFAALFLCSSISLCSLGRREMEDPVPMERSAESFAVTGRPALIGDRLVFNFTGCSFELDLRSLSCIARDAVTGGDTVISKAAFPPSEYRINGELSEAVYPRLGLTAGIDFREGRMTLSLSSKRPREIVWPSISMEKQGTALIWPDFEGSYVPLSDAIWTEYLASREWNTTQTLYMPFWGIERTGRGPGHGAPGGRQIVSYLLENPFHNTIRIKETIDTVLMEVRHVFPDNADLSMPISFTVYVDHDSSPIAPAVHFRRSLEERHAIVTLEEKMKTAPLVSRLIGASHAYIWDGAPITMADVNTDGWIPLASEIVRGATSEKPDAGKQIMRVLAPDNGSFEVMARQTTPAPYLKRTMADALSRALRSPRLYDESVWPPGSLLPADAATARKLVAGETVPEPELVRLNGRLLYASYPRYLNDPSTWGNGVSTRMIDALAGAGMDRFVLTTNDVDVLDIRPWLASYAAKKGYLLGPYDSYDSIHDPGAPEWSTAVFDRALYETGRIVRADGTAAKGFLGVGYGLSPVAAAPYFTARVARNFKAAPSSYYFIDGDAFGGFYDDYNPKRKVAASEDAAARVDRVRSVFQTYKVPVGSEGGSYLFAGSLAVAEGVFFPVITGDADMSLLELSRYFTGRPFPADEPESHFMPALLKEKYVTLYGDPRYRLPLYEAVFHDSVVTTSHYSSPSLKFTNIAETTALMEILYQVAPMYHFNLAGFDGIKGTIARHVETFAKTHSYSYRYPLEEFAWLSGERDVQKTRFGSLVLVANFREEDFQYDGKTVPPRSVLVSYTDTGESFVYSEPALAEKPVDAQGIRSLIGKLSSPEWKIREQAAPDLSRIGDGAGESVPSLVACLGDEEWAVRAAAIKALANMGDAAAPAAADLMNALKDEEWQVRRCAAYALAALGNKARSAVPVLIKALSDEEWHVRRAAAIALGSMGSDARASLPALSAGLHDPELQVRQAAEKAVECVRTGLPLGR